LSNTPSVPNAIEVRNLTKTYRNSVKALDGLNLRVAAGSIFALLGPNGAGKSTTIKILTTLCAPDSGEARVAGIDVLREPQRVRHSIGCVAQKSGVDETATGRENLTLQGQLHDLRGPDLKQRVETLLQRFSLASAAARVASTYSGGMKRKLDIAMGLIHRPQVLFLDEPTTGLDPEARAELWDEIGRLSAEGLSILLTTHYLEEADALASRVVVLNRGKIVAQGTSQEIKGLVSGRKIRCITRLSVETLVTLPTVTSVTPDRDGIILTAVDSDAAVRALFLADSTAHGVEISGGALEDAFLELTKN